MRHQAQIPPILGDKVRLTPILRVINKNLNDILTQQCFQNCKKVHHGPPTCCSTHAGPIVGDSEPVLPMPEIAENSFFHNTFKQQQSSPGTGTKMAALML